MTGSAPTRVNAAMLVVLLFAQLFLMAGSALRLEPSLGTERAIQRGTGSIVAAAAAAGNALWDAVGVFGEVRRARRGNARLRGELETMRTDVELGRERAAENERLRSLLGMREDLAPRSVGADVVAARVSDQSRLIVIAAGTPQGVQTDYPVVAWGGAVGRVVTADSSFAKVRLITDPWSRVAGMVQRSRVQGIVLGKGDRPLQMAYVPKHADVAIGDRVITSGLDGVFPRGFGIGRVIEVGEPVGASKTIRLVPEVDFASLEEVLVVQQPASSLPSEPDAGESAP